MPMGPASFQAEMARTLEELRVKAETMGMEIQNDERLHEDLSNQLAILKEQRRRLKVRITKREASRKEYDRTLIEAAAALKKVQDTCTALMGVTRAGERYESGARDYVDIDPEHDNQYVKPEEHKPHYIAFNAEEVQAWSRRLNIEEGLSNYM